MMMHSLSLRGFFIIYDTKTPHQIDVVYESVLIKQVRFLAVLQLRFGALHLH